MTGGAGSQPFVAAAAVCAAVFAFAFIAAPRSCEGGLAAYVWAGAAALAALFALPLALQRGEPVLPRVGLGILFSAAGLVVWALGLFAAGVRVVCRLF